MLTAPFVVQSSDCCVIRAYYCVRRVQSPILPNHSKRARGGPFGRGNAPNIFCAKSSSDIYFIFVGRGDRGARNSSPPQVERATLPVCLSSSRASRGGGYQLGWAAAALKLPFNIFLGGKRNRPLFQNEHAAHLAPSAHPPIIPAALAVPDT